MCFFNLSQNFSTGLLTRGWYLQKKIVYTWGSLSLSLLHWRRELEERSGGVGPQSGPTTQFPFSVDGPPIRRQFTDRPPSITIHLPLPTWPYPHDKPLCFASCVCVCQQPSLLRRSPLFLSRPPEISYPITGGNNFVSAHHVAYAIKQMLLRRCLHMEFKFFFFGYTILAIYNIHYLHIPPPGADCAISQGIYAHAYHTNTQVSNTVLGSSSLVVLCL